MKTIRLLLAAIVLAACSFSASAGEIFRFGPRIGTEVNSMRLNSDVFNSDNRAGFTGGLMMEVNVPLVGIAFDLSVMYVHRLNNNSLKAGASDSPDQSSMLTADSYIKRDYIEIPLNFKYKIGLPIVGKVVSPYLFTGPSFAFLASKRHINEAYKNKAFDVAWNFGVGLQLFTHLQVGASYGLGITKTVEKVSSITAGPEITGRNNYWTVTAAWLF
ncbi:outer membrane beta-barrel protein [Muribaculum intestinale]|jgi:hypothetical protein|uniref:outer membrane beta-barrel protein n=1 Tax=Muribaculum intestinale TaxID=1796646 RepID=UPI002674F638|nr:outer membrane beta-barrel protein [Muribaculum intestinale]